MQLWDWTSVASQQQELPQDGTNCLNAQGHRSRAAGLRTPSVPCRTAATCPHSDFRKEQNGTYSTKNYSQNPSLQRPPHPFCSVSYTGKGNVFVFEMTLSTDSLNPFECGQIRGAYTPC
eukprot:2294033-Amphidinium_carterae.1